jgi:DNA-binding ferritin-like protein
MVSTQTENEVPSLDKAFEQVKQFNDQVAKAVREAGNLYLDSYEKAIDRTIELELKVADHSQQEWLKDLIQAQADAAREFASSYTTAARSLLK